jgi:prolyl oligopeptidase
MQRNRRVLATVMVATCTVAGLTALPQTKPPKVKYPPTKTVDIVDDYHATKIRDPYRWMEDLESKELADWIAAQNAVTLDYLKPQPIRAHFQKRITALWDYPKTSLPVMESGALFYRWNAGMDPQPSLYMKKGLAGPRRLLFDPNKLWPGGEMALAQFSAAPTGTHLVYALSPRGADWQTLKVRVLASGKDLADEIKWVRFSGLSWTKDGKGFFYSRYPEPPQGKVMQAALSGHAMYYHRIGTTQSEDVLVYERKDLPTWFVWGGATEDGRYLLISLAQGSSNNNRLYYADLGDPKAPNVSAPVKPVVEEDGAEHNPFGNVGSTLYIRTDRDAPNRKVVAIDLANPGGAVWKTILPEAKESLETVALIGGRIVAEHLVDVQSRVTLYGLDGESQGELELPSTGTLAGMSGREDSPTIFFGFSSPLYPTTVFAYDPVKKTRSPFEAAKPTVDVRRYETTRLFATSKDGTRVPYFVTARKGIPRDGNNPTMLYAYGGFSVTMSPTYRSDVPAWLELGGVWVTANLRGGAEYGEAWHTAGMLEKKQNVFDDFIAVAEDLVRQKYASPETLAIQGGSNGGLLVGAVMEQRPDLFAVALPAVGVMDMLRYHQFTGGRAWVTEYGSSSNPSQFQFLVKYSPLHNIKPGVCYPATLVTTADHDDRVVPSHSFKFTAALQAAQACDKPILIRVEKGAHGFRATKDRIAELVDQWTFTASMMGVQGESAGVRGKW